MLRRGNAYIENICVESNVMIPPINSCSEEGNLVIVNFLIAVTGLVWRD